MLYRPDVALAVVGESPRVRAESAWKCPTCGRWIRDEPITRRCAACREKAVVRRVLWVVDTGLTSE